MKYRRYLAVAGALFALGSAQATVLRVKTDSPGPVHDGASWETAYQAVPDALAAAQAGDEVWVAAGTYAVRLTLTPEVGLYGGFAGMETERGQRDRLANATVLDGSGLGRVFTVPPGASAATVVDGFTVRNATSGIFCDRSSPTISHNVITANFELGIGIQGRYLAVAAPRIEGNTISDNGRGIYCDDYASPVITGNRITGNGSDAVFFTGGGIRCSGLRATPTITQNVITGNRAYQGGGIYVEFGTVTVANNVIANNTAQGGGGLAGFKAHGEITNNTLVDNLGGGLLFDTVQLTVVNNVLAFNDFGLFVSDQPQHISSIPFRSNLVYGNRDFNFYGVPDPTGTDGNISADPLFVDRAAGDYHLGPASPAIDMGDGSVVVDGWRDIDDQPRVMGPQVDIGADEFVQGAGISLVDAARALLAASGLREATADEIARWNVVTGETSEALDIRDAVRLARKAAGLE